MECPLEQFALPAPAASCDVLGAGLINHTFLVTLSDDSRYVLQRINRHVFPDAAGLMANFAAVTRALAAQSDDPRRCLRLVPTRGGLPYHTDASGEAWRVMNYIEGGVSFEKPASPADFRSCGAAWGGFLHALRGFPAHTLHETIPRFHDTPDRFRRLRAALDADVCGRAKDAARELGFALEREADAGELLRLRDAGALPLRVTHNDTKCANVLLDAATRAPLCVVDLDTVMPGLAAWDFGDAIRSGARDGERLDLALYRAFAAGYLSACGELTGAELASLPLGAWTMTLECSVRFLTDYLEGDPYFRIDHPAHNLERARTHFALLRDMEEKRGELSL